MEFQKISVTSPPPAQHTEGNENSEGRGGGPKGDNFRGVGGGVASRVFFFGGGEGGPSKIDEQTNSYFAVGGRLSAFFTACTIVYVTQLLSAYD